MNKKNHYGRTVHQGYSYDDLLLRIGYSDILPRDVSTDTQLTQKISLKIPLISAAMDTVTESRMAIAIAREGGLGIVHKSMSIQDQAKEVSRVKRAEAGLVTDAVSILATEPIEEVLRLMAENKCGGVLVTNDVNKLVGIITNRDLRCEKENMKRPVSDLMTPLEKLITARGEISFAEAEKILCENRIEKLPAIDENGNIIGVYTLKDIAKLTKNPNASKDAKKRLLCGAAVGVEANTLERVQALVTAGVDVIVVDSAHGHTKGVIKMVKSIKKAYPELDVIAGNIATAEAAEALIKAGADALKVGIGPGSICTTRIVTGVGAPQMSAIMEVASVANSMNIPVIADGGIKYSGDIVKALAAGASVVMIGSLFAGTEESPGPTEILEGRKVKLYRGMGSIGAMQSKHGSSDRYMQSSIEAKKLVAEGIEGVVPYRGTLKEVLDQQIGGLRQGMGYLGASAIPILWNAEFVEITSSGMAESHPHGVAMTKDAPNYSR